MLSAAVLVLCLATSVEHYQGVVLAQQAAGGTTWNGYQHLLRNLKVKQPLLTQKRGTLIFSEDDKLFIAEVMGILHLQVCEMYLIESGKSQDAMVQQFLSKASTPGGHFAQLNTVCPIIFLIKNAFLAEKLESAHLIIPLIEEGLCSLAKINTEERSAYLENNPGDSIPNLDFLGAVERHLTARCTQKGDNGDIQRFIETLTGLKK